MLEEVQMLYSKSFFCFLKNMLLVDEDNGITGITKVVTEGELEDYLW